MIINKEYQELIRKVIFIEMLPTTRLTVVKRSVQEAKE